MKETNKEKLQTALNVLNSAFESEPLYEYQEILIETIRNMHIIINEII